MMKKLLVFCGVSLLVLAVAAPALAQPSIGMWFSKQGDFAVDTWSEKLWGGAEGQPGNEILASAPDFNFFGAALKRVKLVREGSNRLGDYRLYRTIYKGGTLELLATGPWGSQATASGLRVVNRTWKYADGEMAFRLWFQGPLDDYPCYTVRVVAHYRKGEPEILPPDPVGGDPATVFGDLTWAKIAITGPVPLDIKPGSCPNPVNVRSKGVLPVAVLGAENLDVKNIDVGTIELAGVKPLRWSYEDVATPPADPCFEPASAFDCLKDRKDGNLDLTLKFETQEIVAALGDVEDGDILKLELTGQLTDGSPITGQDVIIILKKGGPGATRAK
jgi:hypothetical protein